MSAAGGAVLVATEAPGLRMRHKHAAYTLGRAESVAILRGDALDRRADAADAGDGGAHIQRPPTPPDSPVVSKAPPGAPRSAPPADPLEPIFANRFAPRPSLLDRRALVAHKTPQVHGFVALFWVAATVYAAVPLLRSADARSDVLRMRVVRDSFTEPVLFAACLLACFVWAFVAWAAAPFLRAAPQRPYALRLALRHALQVVPVAATLATVLARRWLHLQRGVALIYAVGIMMKTHAFLAAVDAGTPVPAVRAFLRYLLFPTLLYETEYPRTPRVSRARLLEHVCGVLAAGTVFYATIETRVYPALRALRHAPPHTVLPDLILPCLACALLVFFLVFEYGLNALAEATRFADRAFYADWWNSEDMAAFARKWNLPVHRFLQRHVYAATQRRHGLRPGRALVLTFLYSSVLHELVLSAAVGRPRLWIFTLQMSQLPLMWAARVSGLSRRPFLAAVVWWAMMVLGFPVLTCLYAREAML